MKAEVLHLREWQDQRRPRTSRWYSSPVNPQKIETSATPKFGKTSNSCQRTNFSRFYKGGGALSIELRHVQFYKNIGHSDVLRKKTSFFEDNPNFSSKWNTFFPFKVWVPCLMVFDDAHVMKAALMGAAHWHEALIALPWDTARLQSLAQSAGLRRPRGAKKRGSKRKTRFDFWKSFSCSPMFANKDPEPDTLETPEMISYNLYDRRSIFGSILKSISLTFDHLYHDTKITLPPIL